MKKVLSTVAALGMIAGYAATASAVDVKISGYYQADGIFYDKGDGANANQPRGGVNPYKGLLSPDGSKSNAFLMHTMHVKPVIQANDKTKVVADLWLADNSIWGRQTGGVSEGDLQTQNGGGFTVHKLFMEYMSPVGKLRIGRTLAGPWGLDWNNSERHANRIMYWPSWGKAGALTTLLFYQKTQDNDGQSTTTDQDNDYYEARFYLKNAPGQSIGTLGWNRNASATNQVSDLFRFKLCGDYLFNTVYVKAEFEYFGGTTEDKSAAPAPDVDIDGIGFFLDVGYKGGNVDAGAMFFYATGDDHTGVNESTNFMSAALGSGQDFEPLYILTGQTTGMLNPGGQFNFAPNADMTEAGVMAIVLHSDYQFNDSMSLYTAIGWAVAESEDPTNNLDDDYGVELDAGMAFKLLDNLTYDFHIGYLLSGDFFKYTDPTGDPEDVFLATNHLTLEF